MGIYHGFREKHLNSYLNEFVFRWNRRRSFQSCMDSLLKIGMHHKLFTYRQIASDTSEWKRRHRGQFYRLKKPDRPKAAKSIVKPKG